MIQTPQQLSDRFIDIWKEVIGREPLEDEPISPMEKAAYKAFITGRETEDGVRKILENIKVFNSR